jgi:hypothetical protein
MKNGVVIVKRKGFYGPMVHAMIQASKELDFNVKSRKDLLSGYDNLILFDNKLSRVDKPLRSPSSANISWWMNDLRCVSDLGSHRKINHLNNIFLCNNEYVDDYRKAFSVPVYYMPQCGHEYESFTGRNFKESVVFIGNLGSPKYHNNRASIINRLAPLKVKHICGEKTTLDMGYIYKHTPISLSISLPVEGYSSNRLYNIIASKGFALVAYYPGIELQFKNHEHLVWFKSPDEAFKLAKKYIQDRKARNKIAANGYKLFLEKHMAKHRIQNMLDIMNGKTESFYGYL